MAQFDLYPPQERKLVVALETNLIGIEGRRDCSTRLRAGERVLQGGTHIPAAPGNAAFEA